MSSNCKAILLLTVATFSFAQGPNEGYIMEAEGTQHLIIHADPIYPPIAKAAHVQGTVLLHVSVDEKGNVTKVELVGKPTMLSGAAIDAVKGWTYRPFDVDGKTTAVKVVVAVPFSLGIPSATEKSDQAIGQAYFPKEEQCRALNDSHKWTEAVPVCADAATIADRFPDPSLRMNELRLAHQDYGQALIYSGDKSAALEQFHRATELAEKSLKPINAEYGSAYFYQAFAEHALRMLTDAERDYAISEDSLRKATSIYPT